MAERNPIILSLGGLFYKSQQTNLGLLGGHGFPTANTLTNKEFCSQRKFIDDKLKIQQVVRYGPNDNKTLFYIQKKTLDLKVQNILQA